MAVKTRFSEEEFVEVLSRYPLGAYVRSRPIGEGTVQTNYYLETAAGAYVFRCYENRSRESVGFECNLLLYLKAHRYPCAAPLKARNGKYVGEVRGKPFVLFEFIEGQHLENPTETQKKQLIQKAAELHVLTRGYRPRSLRHRWNYGPSLCRELAQQAAQAINTPNAWAKLEWYLGEVSNLDLPRSLPKGICHCDFHFSNILFQDGAFAALIDFDDANYTYLTYDLASLIHPFIPAFEWNSWSQFDADAEILDFQAGRAVAAEYMKHRSLSTLEKRHLIDVYKLSVLLDCIWYFERGDVQDFYEKRKLEALNRLGRDGFYRQLFLPLPQDG